MSGAYLALMAVSGIGGLAVLALLLLLVRLPLRFAALRDSTCAAERRRLAREMHDGLAQELASLGYAVDALAATAQSAEDRIRLEDLRGRITSLVAETRCSLAGLRIAVGKELGLASALEVLAASLTDVCGVPIEVAVEDDGARGRSGRLTAEAEGELFRITQEALNNAVKHSHASLIRVDGVLHGAGAHLAISDDGQGFQGPRRGSHGLAVMHERATLIGAILTLGNLATGGFRVAVSLPAERVGRRRGSNSVDVPLARSATSLTLPSATSPLLEILR